MASGESTTISGRPQGQGRGYLRQTLMCLQKSNQFRHSGILIIDGAVEFTDRICNGSGAF